jgi:hypothetical protein
MKKAGYLADKPGFSLFLFFLCLVLFSWPLLSVARSHGAESIFNYLIFVWSIIILLLFLSRRSRDGAASGGKDRAKGEAKDV